MDMEKVRFISSEMVKPAKSLENPPKFKLTAFDLLMKKVPYQQRILFYHSRGVLTLEDLLELLKRSLSEVLVVFYPLAGRVLEDENGDSFIDCGAGQSVKFTTAATDSTLEQLGEFRPCEFCDTLCDMDSGIPKFPWTPEDPLLLFQVTSFSCGGFSLGLAFNHHIVDGTSAWHFMSSWAQVARTGALRNPPDITYGFEIPQLTPEQMDEISKLSLFSSPTSHLENLKQNPETPRSKLATRVYNLEPEMIQKLKAEAAAGANGAKFSSFVVIGAYFWRKVTLARQLPASEVTKFVTIVNCRERVESLSKFYLGNAASGVITLLESGKAHDPDWLSSCCSSLHEKISGCTSEFLVNAVAFYVIAFSRTRPTRASPGFILQPIGSPRHPVYESDFGFGKPDGVTIGTGDLSDGKVYLFPSARGDGGVTATLVLPENVIARLDQLED